MFYLGPFGGKVIKVRHVLSAAGEFIQERRDFFSVKFVIDQNDWKLSR